MTHPEIWLCFNFQGKPSTVLWTRARPHKPACLPTTTLCWVFITQGTTSHWEKLVCLTHTHTQITIIIITVLIIINFFTCQTFKICHFVNSLFTSLPYRNVENVSLTSYYYFIIISWYFLILTEVEFILILLHWSLYFYFLDNCALKSVVWTDLT